MSKLDVFLRLDCEVCRAPEVLSKNTFSKEHLQTTASEFLQKDITNLKHVRQKKVQKWFIYREKKQSMEQRETNSSASYSNWRPSSDW